MKRKESKILSFKMLINLNFCVIIWITGDVMNKNLNALLMIDQEIGDFLYENNALSDVEIANKFEKKGYVDKALRLLSKLSSKNVIELLKRSRYLNEFIDIKQFIKKYPLNKTYLRHNQDMYLEEYKKLENICMYFSRISLNYKEFQEYMEALDTDDVENYLLENMPNDQIYALSCDTTDWDRKLFYFSYFKKS